ncbi:MAG: hypothetical protein GTO18_14115 [Anaerolineales bacterium]|nr:hypothetical protein [Anaerolineales bacterium]
MNLIDLATSSWGPFLARTMCKVLPRQWTYRIGDQLSAIASRQDQLPFVQALRTNMAVVLGLPEDHTEVSQAVQHSFQNYVRGHIDLCRAVESGPNEVYASCEFDPSLMEVIEAHRSSGRGLIIVGAHTCSFDIMMLALMKHFESVQVLTKSNPEGSSVKMNEIRTTFGIDITPISMEALRDAVHRLRNGGVVAIAADVPLENGDMLSFFGKRTKLPAGHARLALKTGAMIVVGTSYKSCDGSYYAVGEHVHQPPVTGDKNLDAAQWTQESLNIIERYIQERPEEWFMPVALWPQTAIPESQDQDRNYDLGVQNLAVDHPRGQ